MLLFAKQFVGCMATAEDIVHDGFIRFWKSRQEHAEDKQLSHLYGCVRWAALDWMRKNKRARVREENYTADLLATSDEGSFHCALENQEAADLVEVALGKLPEEQREVVVLKVWAGLTLQQIGDSLGVSPNTAASRYRYAIAALRRDIGIFNYADGK